MKNKRAMSGIVTTVIMVALVLIGIGVIWAVISNVIQGGVSDVDLQSRCLDVFVKATSVSACTGASCDVVLRREAGGDDIGGVQLVFSDGTSFSTAPHNEAINIVPLGSATVTANPGLTVPPTSVEVTPYIFDESGQPHLCQRTSVYQIG